MKAGSVSLFTCFACKEQYVRGSIAKSGKRKDGSVWYVCKECSAIYKAARQLDQAAYEAANTDRVLTDSGKIDMGWNGVPSEKSLKRRSR